MSELNRGLDLGKEFEFINKKIHIIAENIAKSNYCTACYMLGSLQEITRNHAINFGANENPEI